MSGIADDAEIFKKYISQIRYRLGDRNQISVIHFKIHLRNLRSKNHR